MSSITLIANDDLIKKIIHFYQDNQVNVNNPYISFSAKTKDCTIHVYTSNKVLFQGKLAEEEASIWQAFKPQGSKTKAKSPTNGASSYYIESIGSDEVGTGDYFGPVVVVAAYVPKDIIPQLQALKIDDSKKLTDDHILKIAPQLFKLCPYSLLVVKNEKYNQVMKQPNMNMNKLKALLHKQAIEHLIKKLNSIETKIIIDQFCSPDLFVSYTKDSQFAKKISFHTKAESQFVSVACASMMARYIFLQEFDELSKQVDVTLQKGASNLVDKQGKELVSRYGVAVLEKIAKVHFKNTEKIL
jgi:ribonuclease HIII